MIDIFSKFNRAVKHIIKKKKLHKISESKVEIIHMLMIKNDLYI